MGSVDKNAGTQGPIIRAANGGRSTLKRRIVRIASGAAAVERLALGGSERAAAAQTLRQIRIGDEQSRERDEVGIAPLQYGIRAREVIGLVGDERAAP